MTHGVSVQELPGVGRRFELALGRPGERLSVILHGNQRRDLYVFTSSSQEPAAVLELTEEQARKLAAVLAGTFFA